MGKQYSNSTKKKLIFKPVLATKPLSLTKQIKGCSGTDGGRATKSIMIKCSANNVPIPQENFYC